MQVHCKNRALREELYRAFITRASSGENDNTSVIEQILKLRKERAVLLGYSCHAEVSMASKVLPKLSPCTSPWHSSSHSLPADRHPAHRRMVHGELSHKASTPWS